LKSAYIPYSFLPGRSAETNTLREVGMHITCLVPKDHKKVDLPLDQVDFDVAQLPKDKNASIIKRKGDRFILFKDNLRPI
jgi:hypothetical protein